MNGKNNLSAKKHLGEIYVNLSLPVKLPGKFTELTSLVFFNYATTIVFMDKRIVFVINQLRKVWEIKPLNFVLEPLSAYRPL